MSFTVTPNRCSLHISSLLLWVLLLHIHSLACIHTHTHIHIDNMMICLNQSENEITFKPQMIGTWAENKWISALYQSENAIRKEEKERLQKKWEETYARATAATATHNIGLCNITPADLFLSNGCYCVCRDVEQQSTTKGQHRYIYISQDQLWVIYILIEIWPYLDISFCFVVVCSIVSWVHDWLTWLYA